jgi:hypothetical protein
LASGFTGTPIIPAFQPEPSEHPVADSTVPATTKTKNKANQPLIREIISFRIADLKRLQKKDYKIWFAICNHSLQRKPKASALLARQAVVRRYNDELWEKLIQRDELYQW